MQGRSFKAPRNWRLLQTPAMQELALQFLCQCHHQHRTQPQRSSKRLHHPALSFLRPRINFRCALYAQYRHNCAGLHHRLSSLIHLPHKPQQILTCTSLGYATVWCRLLSTSRSSSSACLCSSSWSLAALWCATATGACAMTGNVPENMRSRRVPA